MSILRFVVTLDAVERVSAQERIQFVTDMATVASAMYATKGTNPLQAHLDELTAVLYGDANGNSTE